MRPRGETGQWPSWIKGERLEAIQAPQNGPRSANGSQRGVGAPGPFVVGHRCRVGSATSAGRQAGVGQDKPLAAHRLDRGEDRLAGPYTGGRCQ